MNQIAISLLRTWSPMVAGAIITFLASHGLHLDPGVQNVLSEVLFVVFSGAYYGLVRLLEEHVHHAFGWLLLAPRKLSYERHGAAATGDNPRSHR